MLNEIIEHMQSTILHKKAYRKYMNELQKCINILNKEKIVQLTGLRYTGKSELVSLIIHKTQIQNNFFYFCLSLDTNKNIKNAQDLKLLLEYRTRTGEALKLVVLEDCNSLEGIKEFIIELYKSKKYTIIIVGNNIKIEGIKKIELFPQSLKGQNISSLNYGGLPHVRVIPDISYKKTLLEAMSYTLFEKDIFIPYSIKNTHNYRSLMSLLASLSEGVSVREIHRILSERNIPVSLVTLIEYINISLTNKIIYRQEVYDFKKQGLIHTQTRYQFTDIGLRSVLSDFVITRYDNILANELNSRGYTVHTGKNGTFFFDCYALKGDTKLGVHYFDTVDKVELRKILRKLAKVPGLTHRYLIVPNKEKLAMRKFFENGVQICELDEFISFVKRINPQILNS